MMQKEPRSDEKTISSLLQHFSGDVLLPHHSGYEKARRVWNAMIDRSPPAIVRPQNVEDVKAVVRFAADQDMLVSIRGGGHNVAGGAVADDALMIDMSQMNHIEVDPEAQTAKVGPGTTWADVDAATQEYGLATPNGLVSTTGVAGLTLGGGFGRLSRMWGLSADNLLRAEVVTADGRLVVASEEENTDLLWGLRGGGGNFGIVTSFEFQLHEVGPQLLAGPIFYPFDDARDILRKAVDFAVEAPRECFVAMVCLTAPPAPFLPEHIHGKKIVIINPTFIGPIEEGQKILAPLRNLANPVADLLQPTEYTAIQSLLDEQYAAGMRNYWKSHNYTSLNDEVIDIIVDLASHFPSPESDILVTHLGGAINDVAPEATAYFHRDAEFNVALGARWQDPEDDQECLQWARQGHSRLAPHGTGGTYVNFIADAGNQVDVAFGANYPRLVQLKTKYDPHNLFQINQNIVPSETEG